MTEDLKKSDKKLSFVSFCRRPFNAMVITFDGIVPICCVNYTLKSVLGDVNKQSIFEIR